MMNDDFIIINDECSGEIFRGAYTIDWRFEQPLPKGYKGYDTLIEQLDVKWELIHMGASNRFATDGSDTGTQRDRNNDVVSREPKPPVNRETPSASILDPDTGITTTSTRNPDGSRTVQKIGKNGKVIAIYTEPVTGNRPPSASAYDPVTGDTVTSQRNPDGSTTITTTNKGGKILSQEILK
ncbi:MAG: hypothetical protein JRJ51_20350 [Deltaproteobacteria bacterium]|nr:hypothetical protein [Deltaproteobacteria bacterium]